MKSSFRFPTKVIFIFSTLIFFLAEGSSWIKPDLSSGQIVYPAVSNDKGAVITYDLSNFISSEDASDSNRNKRKTSRSSSIPESSQGSKSSQTSGSGPKPKKSEQYFVVVNGEHEEFLLKLTPNKRLVTPFTVIEWVLKGGQKIIKGVSQNCFYFGHDQRNPGTSVVAVSNCDGLTGFIRTNNQSYFIEPIKNERQKGRYNYKNIFRNGSFPSNGGPNEQRRLFDEVHLNVPKAHVIYRVDSIIEKLNLSITQDQQFGVKANLIPIAKFSSLIEGLQPNIKGVRSSRRSYDASDGLSEDVYRVKRSISDLRTKRTLKGGRATSVEKSRIKRKGNGVKKKKKGGKRKRDECRKGKRNGNSKKVKLCKSKSERNARRKELKAFRKAKRKNRNGKRKKERKGKRRKKKRKNKSKNGKNKKKNKGAKEEHSSVLEPIVEEWQGYSPDMPWDLRIEAARAPQEIEYDSSPPEVDPHKWLELTVGVDHTVVNFHGEENVEKYVFTLFNIVSAIYEDPSLNANLHIVLLRVIFYQDEAQSQVKSGLAKRSLEAVNRWAERLYSVSPNHLQHDLAVWLTRMDLGGPSGYAPVGGVCDHTRSCTLNRDEGLTSAFIIAHEMGHVMGLSHDGDPDANNTCSQEGLMGSVMAPLVAATFGRFHWSRCSKKEYHKKAEDWLCLIEPPKWANATLVSSSIKYQYSLDEQCRMEFGEGFGLCRSSGMTDPCTFLWCSNVTTPHLCKTKKGPPLEGTHCEEGRWCRHGFCELVSSRTDGWFDYDLDYDEDDLSILNNDVRPPVRHNPQHGGWGSWSDWGPCTRTCGTGITFRTRACDLPAPMWGGRECSGKSEEWNLCNTSECEEPSDLRAQQCKILNKLVRLGRRRSQLSWTPYQPRKRRKQCRLSCLSLSTNEVYIGREPVLDGTPCSYDHPDDVCVQGKCIPVGCDRELVSTMKSDDCGVCEGDNSQCQKYDSLYAKIPAKGYNLVTSLPKGAWNITIVKDSPGVSFLSLRDNSSKLVLNSDKKQEPDKEIITEGSLFRYHKRINKEVLTSRGPLLKQVSVMIYDEFPTSVSVVLSSYSMKKREELYRWELGQMTPCSRSCGGGYQHQSVICRDVIYDEEVSHDNCRHLERMQLKPMPCNLFSCDVRWVSEPWEHCTTTCGTHGVQLRMVSCVRVKNPNSTAVEIDNMPTDGREFVNPLLCHDQPEPINKRACNTKPCPAQWVTEGWSECSTTCGVGQQEQLYRCLYNSTNANEVIDKCIFDVPPPKLVRVCVLPECEVNPKEYCTADDSVFCQVKSLTHYCKLPRYRQLCCMTCLKYLQ